MNPPPTEMEVGERDRVLVAREIHDGVGQLLISLKMEIAACINEASQQTPEISQRLSGIVDGVEKTIQEVRRITAMLRPLVLEDLGLAAAAQWQCQEFEKRTNIRCGFSKIGEAGLDAGLELDIFRILQEALSNAAKHSGASRLSVVLKFEESLLTLTVRDNGRGITSSDHESQGHYGLKGMRERASFWGGFIRAIGVGGKGTMVTLRIPLPAKKK